MQLVGSAVGAEGGGGYYHQQGGNGNGYGYGYGAMMMPYDDVGVVRRDFGDAAGEMVVSAAGSGEARRMTFNAGPWTT